MNCIFYFFCVCVCVIGKYANPHYLKNFDLFELPCDYCNQRNALIDKVAFCLCLSKFDNSLMRIENSHILLNVK